LAYHKQALRKGNVPALWSQRSLEQYALPVEGNSESVETTIALQQSKPGEAIG
jgi:hypothetical protein